MAKHGITDFDAGLDRYILAPHHHFSTCGEFIGLSAEDFILEKVRLRGREYNTILNVNEAGQKRLKVDKAAKDYCKGSDSE